MSAGWQRKSVVRFNIATSAWINLPDLNESRAYHASVALGDYVYVLCGYNENKFHKTLERLDVTWMDATFPKVMSSIFDYWEVINVPIHPRWQPVAAAISSHEIAIMGGCQQGGDASDKIVFDSKI